MGCGCYLTVSLALCWYTTGCSVTKGLHRREIMQQLHQAFAKHQNGTVHLGNLTITTPAPVYSLDNNVVIRAAERTAITLKCRDHRIVPKTEGTNRFAVRFNGVEHGEFGPSQPMVPLPMTTCGCLPPDAAVGAYHATIYNLTSADVHLLNFSNANGGQYECVWYNGGDAGYVSQRYLVSSLLTAQEVFTPPLRNISAKVGESVELRCWVKFDAMMGGMMGRFLWISEKDVLSASGFEQLQHIVRRRDGISVHYKSDANCTCYVALKIPAVRRDDAGSYQCWFKADDIFDEWLVQSAFLTVT
ncbi:uncharacterized protein LOC129592760 [Paramacrobiotus metropolitanus]|uniref:uncharacterized protein LOC129592760 n=1 Tax=Paramacrobiotus metropolitanus TaxID=2943436 RepID=UPI0024465D57|nr:uncharacterized protein LOC129592760 [Paramacrobiotus metropolitanus]